MSFLAIKRREIKRNRYISAGQILKFPQVRHEKIPSCITTWISSSDPNLTPARTSPTLKLVESLNISGWIHNKEPLLPTNEDETVSTVTESCTSSGGVFHIDSRSVYDNWFSSFSERFIGLLNKLISARRTQNSCCQAFGAELMENAK